ncbi:hypothetical protein [Streptomyces sp. NPDC002078]
MSVIRRLVRRNPASLREHWALGLDSEAPAGSASAGSEGAAQRSSREKRS